MSRSYNSIIVATIAFSFATLLVIGASIPFLSGPSSLYGFSNGLYNFASMLSISSLISMPIGLVLIVKAMIRKSKSLWLPIMLLICPYFAIKGFNYVADNFRHHARSRSIQEAAVIITSIEAYHNSTGNFPDSLNKLIPIHIRTIPKPSSMGSLEFSYKRVGETYELEFYQNVIMNFNIEVVMYNPLGLHKGTERRRQPQQSNSP